MPKILSPSDKFQPRGVGDLKHPGTCLACGNGTCEFGYIDLGTFFDYEGQMYLCKTCVEEVGEVVGMLTIDESAFLQTTCESLAEENKRLSKELEDASDRLRAYDSLLDPLVDRRINDLAVEKAPELKTDGSSVTGNFEVGEGGKSEVTKPANGEGPAKPELFKSSNDGIKL